MLRHGAQHHRVLELLRNLQDSRHGCRLRRACRNSIIAAVERVTGRAVPLVHAARRPGDPGGIGFYKWYSQLQVLDTGKSGVTLGFQAVMPAGLEQQISARDLADLIAFLKSCR